MRPVYVSAVREVAAVCLVLPFRLAVSALFCRAGDRLDRRGLGRAVARSIIAASNFRGDLSRASITGCRADRLRFGGVDRTIPLHPTVASMPACSGSASGAGVAAFGGQVLSLSKPMMISSAQSRPAPSAESPSNRERKDAQFKVRMGPLRICQARRDAKCVA